MSILVNVPNIPNLGPRHMLGDLHSETRDLSQAAARDYRRYSIPGVIDSEEVVCLRDERERIHR